MTGINRCSYRPRRSNCIQETVFIPTADRHDASGSGTTILVIILTPVLLKDVGSVKVGENGGRGGRGERRGREGWEYIHAWEKWKYIISITSASEYSNVWFTDEYILILRIDVSWACVRSYKLTYWVEFLVALNDDIHKLSHYCRTITSHALYFWHLNQGMVVWSSNQSPASYKCCPPSSFDITFYGLTSLTWHTINSCSP